MTRTQFGCFCAGVAAGAVGYAHYPKLKEKLAPVLDATTGLVTEAFSKAAKDAMATAENLRESTIRMAPDTASKASDTNAA